MNSPFMQTWLLFVVTVGCLVMQQRYERQYGQYNTVPSHVRRNDEEYGHPILIDDSQSSGLGSESLEPTPRLRAPSRTRCTSIGCAGRAPNQDSHISISEDGLEAGPSKPKMCMSEIEDFDGDGDDESLFSYNDDLCAPGKQSCSLAQRKKCTALLEKYRSRSQLTEPEEIGIVRDRDDEFQMLRHIILLLLLCGSMFVVRLLFFKYHINHCRRMFVRIVRFVVVGNRPLSLDSDHGRCDGYLCGTRVSRCSFKLWPRIFHVHAFRFEHENNDNATPKMVKIC